MSMKNAQTSKKTLLGRILGSIFGTGISALSGIKTPRVTGCLGYGDGAQGYNFRSSQAKRRKMERRSA